MDQLSLRCFGVPDVRYGGQNLKFRSRKELALLIYLAVEEGQHSREQLIALFWPESDRQHGQASLRNTLARLRQGLAGAESYLIIAPSTVGFAVDLPFEFDLHIVRTALQTLDAATKPAELTTLQAALALYRGDFLAGFALADAPEFDNWISLQREVWHQRVERLWDYLSQWQPAAGQVAAAIETTRQWLTRDSVNEAAYRRLMQLYFLVGDRTAALRTFAACSRVLAEELGVEPDTETKALAERIKRDKMTRWQDDKRKDGHPLTQSSTPKGRPLVMPFVGRASEHGQLVAVYQALGQGKLQMACVLGEAGIGKSRLSEVFLTWAILQQADILSGRTYETGGQLPYQPLVDAMRERLERENAPDDLLADVWLAELSQLLPELRDRYPDLPSPTIGDPNVARTRLFEAVAQFGQALAKRSSVVLFIDDLQWADAATLELIPYLCRRWAESQARILLLCTVRREALATMPKLREWLTQLGREASLTRLVLYPLTVEATRQLVHTLAGEQGGQEDEWQPATRNFSDWLFAETAGQPFFMAETIKMLVEQAILQSTYQPTGRWAIDFCSAVEQIQRQEQLPMPPNIREVIVARLGRLSEPAGALLVAGAVLGRTSSFEQLCQVSGIDELAGLAALDELVKSQLFLETADNRRPYTFAHDKLRDVVYTEAGDARRRVYHRRAFTTLQAAASPAGELAHHALAARLLEPAFHYSVTAGDEAANVYAYAEAISHYRRALDLVNQQEDRGVTHNVASVAELTQLYLRLGRTLELLSQHEQALATYETMGRFAQLRGDQPMQLAALMARITPLATVTAVFNPAQAEVLAGHALHVAQALGDHTAEAQILWNQLIIYRNSNQFRQAIACGERALTLARQLNLHQQIAFILNDLGYCYAFMGHFTQAKSLFYEVSHLWRALGNQLMVADSLTGACAAHVFTGEYDPAIACFEEALQISQTVNTVWALAGCRHNIGFAYGDRGEMARAIAEMEESIRLSEIVSFISPLIIVHADLATVYGALGTFERGLEMARQAVRVAETKMPLFRVYPLAVLTHLHLLQGHLADAETLVAQMKSDPHREGIGFFPVLILQAEAELALAQDDHERAYTLAEAAIVTARQLDLRPYVLTALQLQGQALLNAGQLSAARERLLAACAEAEAIGARLRLWPILFNLSQLETDPTVANRLRQQAQEVVAYVVAHTPSQLQTTFLASAAVQKVLRKPRA